jgi:hypothetical protein
VALHFDRTMYPRSVPELARSEDNRRVSNGDQVSRVAALAMKRGQVGGFHRILAEAYSRLSGLASNFTKAGCQILASVFMMFGVKKH